jgi:hypothetical protein
MKCKQRKKQQLQKATEANCDWSHSLAKGLAFYVVDNMAERDTVLRPGNDHPVCF